LVYNGSIIKKKHWYGHISASSSHSARCGGSMYKVYFSKSNLPYFTRQCRVRLLFVSFIDNYYD